MTNRSVSRRAILQLASSATVASLLPSEMLFASAINANPLSMAPNDARIGALKDLNGYFPFVPSASVAEWNVRKEFVVRQLSVACGLWPMPKRPPIKATVHGRVERDDYTVDRVYFESSPGLLVTGSLYLPKNASGRLPTILCPHGHWANGRFHDHGDAGIKTELASGGEKFEIGGRHPLQARCVQLARMGCMVFLYDMMGYADGSSFTQPLAHGFAKQRPKLSSPETWGMFSAQSELRSWNTLGLQTWNSIRIVDWLTSRPDCDTSRIGVTGASGGGTQTFILAALDERIAAAFPAVMVSTAMQGGCTCENASYLRVNTGNIEIAALVAPRPIAMSGADDWTVEIETKGLPELQKHYAMLGVPENVHAKYFKFPHNFNQHSRMMMYDFFNQALKLGVNEIVERDYVPLTVEEATVFSAEHPAPVRTEETEVSLLHALDAAQQNQIAALAPHDAASLKEYRRIIGGAFEVMIGRSLPPAGSTHFEKSDEISRNGFLEFKGVLELKSHGEELPAVFLLPEKWNQQVVLWFDLAGKNTVFADGGRPGTQIAKLLKAGFAIGSADLYLTGDFTENHQPVAQSPVVGNPREFAGFTLGYNHSLFAQRVHDVLTCISSAKFHEQKPARVHVVGVNGAGTIAAAACAISGDAVSAIAVDTAGFRFESITEIRDVNLLPGAIKYGDVAAILALCSPTKLAVASEKAESVAVTMSAYKASAAAVEFLPKSDDSSTIIDWLLKQV
ncbi:MAG: acetylxylan esterase [Planctomycetota bacterium]|nr:acetylxylan esterase [Planctomycetota bacterium]